MSYSADPTFAIRTDLKAVRLNQLLNSVLVWMFITCAFFIALLTVGYANAQTHDTNSLITLPFSDFFQHPVGSEGLVINERMRQAQGRQVRLTGYMVQQEKIAPGQFLLAQRPVLMSQHADGEADDLPPATVLVELSPEQQDSFVAYTRGVIDIVGELDVGRKEGSDGRVSWVRLRLSSNGTRAMNKFEYLSYQHSIHHKH
jgi:hypothetical protein